MIKLLIWALYVVDALCDHQTPASTTLASEFPRASSIPFAMFPHTAWSTYIGDWARASAAPLTWGNVPISGDVPNKIMMPGEEWTRSSGATPGEEWTRSSGAKPGEELTRSSGAKPGEEWTRSSGAKPGEEWTSSSGSTPGEEWTSSSGAKPGEEWTRSSGAKPGEEWTRSSGATAEWGKAPASGATTEQDIRMPMNTGFQWNQVPMTSRVAEKDVTPLAVPSVVPFTGLPFPLQVPFKGNSLATDTALIPINFLADPWARILLTMSPVQGEKKKETASTGKKAERDFELTETCINTGFGCMAPHLREIDREFLCLRLGIRCGGVRQIPIVTEEEEKCLFEGRRCEQLRIHPQGKLRRLDHNRLCKTTGICIQIRD